MENKTQTKNTDTTTPEKSRSNVVVIASTLLSIGMVVTALLYSEGAKIQNTTHVDNGMMSASIQGVVLPVRWGNLGAMMIREGVIDQAKLEALYANRGGIDRANAQLLSDTNNDFLVMNDGNAGFLLNMFWALGLGTKNDILENGPMSDSRYGGAGRFASTGGWTLSAGNPMDHFSRHPFITLTPEQQAFVERMSKNIYRPCCNNATHFPDCNHGMAMLGFLELMASQGVSEEKMYDAALQVNQYWFPDTYKTIDQYFLVQGIDPGTVPSKEKLGINYSSISGYQKVLSFVTAPQENRAGGCGV